MGKPMILYEDEYTFGSRPEHYLTGNQRFYIDTRLSKYSYLHHHNCAEVSFYFEGSGVETINGISRRLAPGTMSVVLPHQLHIINWDPDQKLKKFMCMFDTQLLSGMDEDNWFSTMFYGIGSSVPSFVHFSAEDRDRMFGIFTQIHQEYLEPFNPGRVQLIRTKLNEALILFIRKGLELRSQPAKSGDGQDEQSVLFWQLLRYIHSHYDEKLKLSDLAERFYMSVPYLSKFFKTNVGMGFVDYLHHIRIERASGLLVQSDLTIAEIAHQVGFDNSRTFSRVFRELKGRSAKEYRQIASRKEIVSVSAQRNEC